MISITVKEDEAGERLDFFLSKKYPDYSRSYFVKLIKDNKVQINDKPEKPSFKLTVGDTIQIEFIESFPIADLKPQEIDLNIVFENNDAIVVNKQPGLVVHPAAGNPSGTLVNALIHHFPKIQEAVYEKGNPVSEARPGLVHRLDKNTSGLLIVAKNARAMHSLSRQIQNRTVTKKYLAFCFGWLKKEEDRLVNHLGRHPKNRKLIAEVGERGKEAISDYKLIKCFTYKNNKISLIEFDIKTGRTHQIRVQSRIIGNPVLGDTDYGTKESIQLSNELGIKRQLLHSHTLTISLPGDTKSSEFVAPLPQDFLDLEPKLMIYK